MNLDNARKNAKNVNLSYFENLKKDKIVRLAIFEDDDVSEFEYKHDAIYYSDKFKNMVTIHGFERIAGEWYSTTMFSNNSYTLNSLSGDGNTVWHLERT